MKRLQVTISLEQFKSRFPGIITSYYGDNKWEFSNQTLPHSNYGMCPYSIVWNGDVVSYHRFNNWYHFLLKYIETVSNGHCLTIYNSAYDMYLKNKELYSEQDCLELDKKVSEICKSSGTLTSAQDAVRKMKSLFPIFSLSKEVYNIIHPFIQNYVQSYEEWLSIWGSSSLSVEGVFQWMQWLDDNAAVSQADNCCVWLKYHQLGGKNIRDMFNNFLTEIKSDFEYAEPYLIVRVPFSVSINNLGEYSVFAEQWEPGINYQSPNGQGGAVIEYNNNEWQMREDFFFKELTGYKYSHTFKEIYFGNEDGMTQFELENYLDTTFGPNNVTPKKDSFIRRHLDITPLNIYKTYAYTENNTLVFDPSPKKMALQIPIDTNNRRGFFIINGKELQPKYMPCITYKGMYYPIYDDDESNPTLMLHGVIYHATYECGVGYKFTIGTDTVLITNKAWQFIIINNEYVPIVNKTAQYNGITYNQLLGKIKYNNNTHYVGITQDNKMRIVDTDGIVLYENTILLGQYLIGTPSSSDKGYKIENNVIYAYNPYITYDVKYVSGETESKLSTFMAIVNPIYDDLGNKLPGQFRKKPFKNGDSTIQYVYSNPTENSWLDLYYSPGLIAHAIVDKEEQLKTTYWCDFIDKMIFYFADSNGVKHFTTTLTSDDVLLSRKTTLDAIDECINKKNQIVGDGLEIINQYGELSSLKCDIIYYMGALVERPYTKSTTGLFIYNNGYNIVKNTGVKYIDTVYLLPKRYTYYMSETQCYDLNYYDITWDLSEDKSTPKANFIFLKPQETTDDGYVNFPILREEYKIGTIMHPQIESGVKIDRGISRAFDKHIKLLEIKSLEALEQYNNGFFKIINE